MSLYNIIALHITQVLKTAEKLVSHSTMGQYVYG